MQAAAGSSCAVAAASAPKGEESKREEAMGEEEMSEDARVHEKTMAEAARLAGLAADEELARALSSQRSERLSVALRRAPGGDLASRRGAPATDFVERRPTPIASAPHDRPRSKPTSKRRRRAPYASSDDDDDVGGGSDDDYVPSADEVGGAGRDDDEEEEEDEKDEDDDSDAEEEEEDVDSEEEDEYEEDEDMVPERVVNGVVIELDEDGDDLEEGEIAECGKRARRGAAAASGGRRTSSSSGGRRHGKSQRQQRRERTARLDKSLYTESDDETEEHALPHGLVAPGRLWKRLFEHQRLCLEWLCGLHDQHVGGIIGDEMGLGKTLQVISLIASLHHSERGGPCLIVAPATVLRQWQREFRNWAPELMTVAILHSSGGADQHGRVAMVRDVCRQGLADGGGCSVLITSYEMMRVHAAVLLAQRWLYVVLDEGHKIRNPDAEITLVAKRFNTGHRLILTGAPIQNKLAELWSLFDFVYPGKLGTLPMFEEQFALPISQGAYANASNFKVQAAFQCSLVLRDLIRPYLLRRTKVDVQLPLPSKSEQVLFCQLTEEQRDVYERFLRTDLVQKVLQGRANAFAALSSLLKVCNHPHLLTWLRDDDDDLHGDGFSLKHGGGGAGERSAHGRGGGGGRGGAGAGERGGGRSSARPEGVDAAVAAAALGPSRADGATHYGDWKLSGKMVVMRQILLTWQQRGDRALIFCQTKQMLDIVQGHVLGAGYTFRRLDGSTPVGVRLQLIDEFNSDDSIFLFLLTTRAGGLGINLTGANRVLLVDPDWNPANDMQARERAHRMGQKRAVTIYRLVTSGTLEEKVYQRQIFKQFLSSNVLTDPKQMKRVFKPRDLRDLLAPPATMDSSVDGTETGDLFAHAETTAAQAVEHAETSALAAGAAHGAAAAADGAAVASASASSGLASSRGADGGRGLTGSSRPVGRPTNHVASDEPRWPGSRPTSLVAGRTTSPLGDHLGEGEHLGDAHSADGSAADAASTAFVASLTGEPAGLNKQASLHERRAPVAAAASSSGTMPVAPGAPEERAIKSETSLLSDLLCGNFLASTIDHDAVLGGGKARAGSSLAAADARQLAQKAAEALRESFAQRQREHVNVPTWTGRSGAAGLPGQRRFGGTLNPVLARSGSGSGNGSGSGSGSGGGEGGSKAGGSTFFSQGKESDGRQVGSAALLSRIRERQEAGATDADSPDAAAARLLRRLDDFFAARHGKCTSEQLVKEFADASVDRNLLKALLKQLAHKDDRGNWVLKPHGGGNRP